VHFGFFAVIDAHGCRGGLFAQGQANRGERVGEAGKLVGGQEPGLGESVDAQVGRGDDAQGTFTATENASEVGAGGSAGSDASVAEATIGEDGGQTEHRVFQGAMSAS
jgi:hypothetical protein